MLSIIKEKILEQPSRMITYAEFIELALYHPQFGYYMKPVEKIGRKGDFITTSNISDIYGRQLAKWFFKLKEKHQLPAAVCEIGGGNGRFAWSFIDEWRHLSNEALNYTIVETSPYHREQQKDLITFENGIQQVESIENIRPFEGFIFSNELFDALPVHVIKRQEGELYEVMVAFENDQLIERAVPLKNQEILMFLEKSKMNIYEKQRIEIPLMMEELIRKIANVLIRGMVVTVDYGYSDQEWMEPIHRDGSLRGYYKHEQFNQVLLHPGEMDITSHVHFDSLIRLGEENGLSFVSKERQDEFLISIGILKELEDHYDPNPFSEVSRRNRAIRSLILPSGISTYFHAIVQQKGI